MSGYCTDPMFCTDDLGSAGCPWESETQTQTYNDATGDWRIVTAGKGYVPAPKYRVEVRSDEDGSVDEVLLHDATRCLLHLERMDDDSWWLGIYPEADPDERLSDACFDIVRVKKRVEVWRQL